MTDIEVTWLRSSFCANGACLEASCAGRLVLVRDSKQAAAAGLIQQWVRDEWVDLLHAVRLDFDHVAIDKIDGGVWFGLHRHEALRFTAEEWAAFVAGVIEGEFKYELLPTYASTLPSSAPSEGYGAGLAQVGSGVGTRSDQVVTGAGAIAVPPVPVTAHHQTAGWGGEPGQCGVECACGTTFDGFDTIAEAAALLDGHIAAAAPVPAAPPVPVTADYGDLVVRRIEPRYIVEEAPPRALVALEVLLAAGDDRGLYITRDVMYIGEDAQGNEVAYQVTGWDPKAMALVVERRADLDTPAPPSAVEMANEWARSIAPLNPETSPSDAGGEVTASLGCVVVTDGGADPVPVAGTGSAVPDREEIERRNRLAESWAEDD